MTSILRISALALLLAGCAQVQVKPVLLPVPAEPVLTPVKADAFKCPVVLPMPWTMCITDDTYTQLVDRERALRTSNLELRAVIRANNKAAQ